MNLYSRQHLHRLFNGNTYFERSLERATALLGAREKVFTGAFSFFLLIFLNLFSPSFFLLKLLNFNND